MSRRRRGKKKSTELHDALWSLGADTRVNRLSDAEFSRQFRHEVKHLATSSADHFGNAIVELLNVLRILYKLLFCASEP